MTWRGADVLLSVTCNGEIWKQLRIVSNPLREPGIGSLENPLEIQYVTMICDVAVWCAYSALLVILLVSHLTLLLLGFLLGLFLIVHLLFSEISSWLCDGGTLLVKGAMAGLSLSS